MPGVTTPYSGRGIDLVVVRENVEDLYAGIEYMQTPSVAQTLKLISVKGSEKIARFAFEYARSEGRTKVACATKANIMKFSEGTMKRAFERVAPDYPEIESWHVIVDNAAHQLVKRPEQFEVLTMTNMNGDILSDLTSALIGGLGFAPSANIGNEVAIFEAVHGSAPKYAGKDVINPTAVILAGVLMLRHLGLVEEAAADRARDLRDARGRDPHRRRRRATTAGRPPPPTRTRSSANLGSGPRTGRSARSRRCSSPSSTRGPTTCGRPRAPWSGWTCSSSRRSTPRSWAPR